VGLGVFASVDLMATSWGMPRNFPGTARLLPVEPAIGKVSLAPYTASTATATDGES
jgi:hypothetical protein